MSSANQAQFLTEFVDLLGQGFLHGNVGRPRVNPNKIPVDVVNEEKTIYVYAEIPGVNKENINVDFYNNKLTISVEKSRTYENPEVKEIKFGNFERTLTLPICITKREAVSVSYNNGILKVKINKLLEEENRFSVRPTD